MSTPEVGSGNSITCVNPANQQPIASVPFSTSDHIRTTVRQARELSRSWRWVELQDRLALVENFRRLLAADAEATAALITLESGKPRMESLIAEVFSVLETCTWLLDNAESVLAPEPVRVNRLLMPGKRVYNVYEPLGVIAVVAPWNYPFSIPVATMLTALVAGNAVILKPSPKTALVADYAVNMLRRAGFPADLVGLVQGDRKEAEELILSGGVDRVMFTGSVNGGRAIMGLATRKLIPVSLELGGKHAAIVLRDSNVEAIAQALVWAAFTNAGQACASIERLYVEEPIAEALTRRIVELTKELRLGDGMNPDTDIGPLVDASQVTRIGEQVTEAVERGAKILCGGHPRPDLVGNFYEPTVITNVSPDMRIMREEIFGPVLPIQVVRDADEAVALANDSHLGLGASIWTPDTDLAEDLARRIDAGMVWVNDSLYTHAIPDAPWGGIKESGFGRMHSACELKELVYCKNIGVNRQTRQDWHHPYGSNGLLRTRGGIKLMHGRNLFERAQGLWMVARATIAGWFGAK